MPRKIFETRDDVLLLALRVTLGGVMLPHGAQKMLGWFGGAGLGGTVAGFRDHFGIFPALAVMVIVAEFFGSLGLLAGFLTRLSALGIGAVMLGAARIHLPHGFFMNWLGDKTGEGMEYHLLAIGLALALVVRGGGSFSLDRWLSRSVEHPLQLGRNRWHRPPHRV